MNKGKIYILGIIIGCVFHAGFVLGCYKTAEEASEVVETAYSAIEVSKKAVEQSESCVSELKKAQEYSVHIYDTCEKVKIHNVEELRKIDSIDIFKDGLNRCFDKLLECEAGYANHE